MIRPFPPARAAWMLILLACPRPAPADATPAAPDTSAAHAGMHHDHSMMMHDHSMMDMPDHASMHHEHGGMSMTGAYGPYPMSREASGTAWQPDAAPHRGLHAMRGPWMLMLHGMADLVADRQGGPRGADAIFSASMLMGMARRPLGPGTLGFRAMMSAEPWTIPTDGYPLLLQTGETADGRTPLVDRQHPHDLFMELSGSYSVQAGDRSLFVYGGLPGEPALGPPAFMHRFAGAMIPAAPIAHHWLDSSHITFGVLTAGAVAGGFKLEASSFHGREPDQDRLDLESGALDSHAFRLSVNPTPAVALQVSHGRLHSPEQLEPELDTDRTTASAMVDGDRGDAHWEAMLAWGRNRNRPGRTLDAVLVEAGLELHDRHHVFLRAEHVQKDELFFEPDPRAGQAFDVGALTAGYRIDLWRSGPVRGGLGALGTLSQVPAGASPAYGSGTPRSAMVFAHLELR